MPFLSFVVLLPTVACSPHPPFAASTASSALHATPSAADEGDEAYRFLAGLAEKGLLELVVEEGERFLREHRRHSKAALARYRLATALFELGRRDEARAHFDDLSDERAFDYRAECLFRLGQCELERGAVDRARRAFRATTDAGSDYLVVPAAFFLGETELRAGQFEAASTWYERVLAATPDGDHAAGARRGLAWCAFESGNPEATVERAREYLARHGDATGSDELRVLCGEALLSLERPEEARAVFRTVRAAEFSDAALRGRAFARAAAGEHEQAARLFEELVRKHPDSRHVSEARLHQGVESLLAGDARAAAAVLTHAQLQREPEALYWLSRAQAEQGQNEQALATLEAAVSSSSADGEFATRLHVARGELLERLGRTDEARRAFERSGSDYALYAAAVAALNAGEAEAALRYAERVLSEHPASPHATDARALVAEAHFQAGRMERAEEVFRALAGQGDDAERARIAVRMAWCRYLRGAHAEAARGLERVLEDGELAQDDASEALHLLGRARLDAGDSAGAREAWQSYLARFSGGEREAEVLYALALASDGEAALAPLEALVRRHAQHELAPAGLFLLGERLSELGRWKAALERYTLLLQRQPDAPEAPRARYGSAWCSYEDEDDARAAEALAPLLSDASVAPELRASAAELAVWVERRRGDLEAAERAWRMLLALTTDDTRRFESARVVVAGWSEANEPARGTRVLDELLANLHTKEVARRVLVEGAYLALEEGDVDRAEARVRVAQRESPQDPAAAEASFFVAEARFEAGDVRPATELYERALIEGSPVAAQALYKLGFAHLEKNELERAAQRFESLVREHGESDLAGEALFLLGEARYRAGELERALQAFATLLEQHPQHEVVPKALFRSGLALGALERYAEAERFLRELAKTHPAFLRGPNGVEAELWRGKALAGLRRTDDARRAFARVLERDQGELAAEARLSLGRLHEAEGRIEEALSEFLKVAVLFGHADKVAEALVSAGRCLEAKGDRAGAERQYREVLEEHPQSPAAKEARARLAGARSE